MTPAMQSIEAPRHGALAPGTAARDRYVWLDLVRGLCAILVCAGHLRAAVLVDFSSLESVTWWHRGFYLVTGLGHECVMVFFVLSGFFVGGSVLDNRARFDVGRYAIARLSRLWVVLMPALFVTASIDLWISALAPEVLAGKYSAAWNSGPPGDGHYSASVGTFVGNLLFLQTVTVPVFGTNDPLWSLANEFWYYAVFPLFAVASGVVTLGGRTPRAIRALAGVLGATAFLWLPWVIQSEFSIWLLGLAVYASLGRVSPRSALLFLYIGAALFAASLAYSKWVPWQLAVGVPREAVVGTAFCALCVGLVNMRRRHQAPTPVARLAHGSSEMSFSLYLIHFPIVALIGGTRYGSGKLAPDASGLLHYSLWLILILFIGAAFWWLFERNTDAVRRLLTSTLISTHRRPLSP